MIDSPDINQVTENLRETHQRILKLIAGMGGLNVPQEGITKRINLSKQAVHSNIKELDSLNLLDRKKNNRKVFIDLKKDSLPVIFSDSPHETKGGHGVLVLDSKGKVSPKGDLEGGMVRIHNVLVSFEFQDQYNLDTKKERWIKQELNNWKYSETEDRYIGYRDNNQVRVTADKVFFHMGDRVGWDINRMKKDIMVDAFRLADQFENNSDIVLKRSRNVGLEVTVEKEHVALVGEPLGRYIDEHTEIDIKDFKVRSKDGKVLYEWDKSEGPLELESKDWGFSESAVRNLRKFWKVLGESDLMAEDLRDLSAFYKIVMKMKDGVDDIGRWVEDSSNKINRIDSELNDLRDSLNKSSDNRGKKQNKGKDKTNGLYDYDQDEVERFRNKYF